ncbi:MAG: MBL fold metallo-hydrolase [Pirellulales bacterium]
MAAGLYCLEVGHGNCLVVLEGSWGDGRATLVDVGADGRRLAHWLRGLGVTYLPLIVATHNDRDHVRGLTQLVCQYRGRIGRLRFLRDRGADPPFWQDALYWGEAGWIESIERLEAPAQPNPGDGAALMPEGELHPVASAQQSARRATPCWRAGLTLQVCTAPELPAPARW